METTATHLKRRERSAAEPTVKCAICSFPASRFDPARGEAEFRGVTYFVCGPCRRRYSHSLSQISSYGTRFRFVEKSEIPRYHGDAFEQLYKILLLCKERQEIRQKEVNWMVEDQTKMRLKLPDRVAVILGKTFAVCGDDAKLPDDQALIRIRDLLEAIDPEIINRNKNKRLP